MVAPVRSSAGAVALTGKFAAARGTSDNFCRMSRGWLLALVVVAACKQTPAERADIVCTTFCDCIEGTTLPTVVQQCIDTGCLPTLPPVTDACLACVYAQESSCPDLVNDCTAACLQHGEPG